MALRFMEGFEVRQSTTYFGRLYASYSGTTSPTTVSGRLLGSAVGQTNMTWKTPALVSSVENVWIAQFAVRKPTRVSISTSTPGVAFFDSGSGIQLEARFVDADTPNTGMFKVQILRGATVLATSPVYDSGATQRAWHLFQLKVTIHATTGTYELKHWDHLGNVTTAIAAASGVNTANQGTAGADQFRFSSGDGSSNSVFYFDDIAVMDGTGSVNNDFFDPIVVMGELPDTDGDSSDWEPSSGSDHSALVDDAANSPSETGEVSSPTVGDVDLYTFTSAQLDLAPTTTPPDVIGVMVDVEASMKNSGTATLRVEVKDGVNQATDATDLPFTGTAKVSLHAILEENPTGTPAPWTVADLQSIQIGVRHNA